MIQITKLVVNSSRFLQKFDQTCFQYWTFDGLMIWVVCTGLDYNLKEIILHMTIHIRYFKLTHFLLFRNWEKSIGRVWKWFYDINSYWLAFYWQYAFQVKANFVEPDLNFFGLNSLFDFNMKGIISVQEYQVTNLYSDYYLYTVIIRWDNPEVEFTGLILNYSTYYTSEQSITLESNAPMYQIENLGPGTDVFVTLHTFLNGQLMASSDILSTSTSKPSSKSFLV